MERQGEGFLESSRAMGGRRNEKQSVDTLAPSEVIKRSADTLSPSEVVKTTATSKFLAQPHDLPTASKTYNPSILEEFANMPDRQQSLKSIDDLAADIISTLTSIDEIAITGDCLSAHGLDEQFLKERTASLRKTIESGRSAIDRVRNRQDIMVTRPVAQDLADSVEDLNKAKEATKDLLSRLKEIAYQQVLIPTGKEEGSGFIEVGSAQSRVQPRSPAPDLYRDSGDNLWQGGSAGSVGVPHGLSDMARRGGGGGGGDSEDDDDERRNSRLGHPEDADGLSAEEEDEDEEEEGSDRGKRKARAKPTIEALKAKQKLKATDTITSPPTATAMAETRPRDFGFFA